MISHGRCKVEVEPFFSRQHKRITHASDINFDFEIDNINTYIIDFVEKMALTMLDTRKVPGLILDPFSKDSSVGKNTVAAMPSDFYFLVRTVQLVDCVLG